MASESSGFAIAREGLTHDMLKPISAYPRISSALTNAGGASRSQPHRDIFEALRGSQLRTAHGKRGCYEHDVVRSVRLWLLVLIRLWLTKAPSHLECAGQLIDGKRMRLDQRGCRNRRAVYAQAAAALTAARLQPGEPGLKYSNAPAGTVIDWNPKDVAPEQSIVDLAESQGAEFVAMPDLVEHRFQARRRRHRRWISRRRTVARRQGARPGRAVSARSAR